MNRSNEIRRPTDLHLSDLTLTAHNLQILFLDLDTLDEHMTNVWSLAESAIQFPEMTASHPSSGASQQRWKQIKIKEAMLLHPLQILQYLCLPGCRIILPSHDCSFSSLQKLHKHYPENLSRPLKQEGTSCIRTCWLTGEKKGKGSTNLRPPSKMF